MGVYYYVYKEKRDKTIFLREFSKTVVMDKSQRRPHRAVFSLVVLEALSTGKSH